ncbi:hypothetical protein FACS1894219_08920 [Clostridia bacterium]|nr:hypothetical protein FACS1894219_08920 [Clostridia bacterium]
MFKAEHEVLIPRPFESFRVITMENAKADKYSIIHFENKQYSTSLEYAGREMWFATIKER